MNPLHLPPISLKDLGSYREDFDGLKRFEKRFALPCQIGFFSVFGGILAMLLSAKGTFWPIPFIVIGTLLLAGGLLAMFYATPRSLSGQPMKKYWNQGSDSRGNEVIYVCEDSKTYFRRTWAKNTR